jgi:hypothetical protein
MVPRVRRPMPDVRGIGLQGSGRQAGRGLGEHRPTGRCRRTPRPQTNHACRPGNAERAKIVPTASGPACSCWPSHSTMLTTTRRQVDHRGAGKRAPQRGHGSMFVPAPARRSRAPGRHQRASVVDALVARAEALVHQLAGPGHRGAVQGSGHAGNRRKTPSANFTRLAGLSLGCGLHGPGPAASSHSRVRPNPATHALRRVVRASRVRGSGRSRFR